MGFPGSTTGGEFLDFLKQVSLQSATNILGEARAKDAAFQEKLARFQADQERAKAAKFMAEHNQQPFPVRGDGTSVQDRSNAEINQLAAQYKAQRYAAQRQTAEASLAAAGAGAVSGAEAGAAANMMGKVARHTVQDDTAGALGPRQMQTPPIVDAVVHGAGGLTYADRHGVRASNMGGRDPNSDLDTQAAHAVQMALSGPQAEAFWQGLLAGRTGSVSDQDAVNRVTGTRGMSAYLPRAGGDLQGVRD